MIQGQWGRGLGLGRDDELGNLASGGKIRLIL
jgi:hypothetical protein